MRRAVLLSLAVLLSPLVSAWADAPAADFKPDPRSVRRHGPAYRYPQAGWIVLHIEGAPYERGYQHGWLLAPEIASYVRCFAATQGAKSPTEAWKVTCRLVNALLPREGWWIRTILGYRPGTESEWFNPRQELSGKPHMPGLRMSVARIFAR